MAKTYRWSDGKQHSIPESQHKTNLAAKRKATGPGKLTVADRIRLGPTASAVKSSVPASQWRQIVSDAHKRGFTVPGALSDVPDELKPRTRTSLQAQAKDETTAAYAPAGKALDVEEAQAQGMRDARYRAEQTFNDWYSQKVTEINNATTQAQGQYQDWADKTAATNAAAARADAAKAAATAQAGQGADLSNSIYLQGAKDRAESSAQKAELIPEAARATGVQISTQNAGRVQNAAGSYLGQIGKVSADYGKEHTAIGNKRLSLESDRAAAQVKAYTDLLDTEISKANANRQADISLQTLTQKGSEAALQHKEFLLGLHNKTATSKRSAATTRAGQKTQQGIATADREARALQGHMNRINALKVAAKAHPGKNGAPSPEERKLSREMVSRIHTVMGMIRNQKNGQLLDPVTDHYHSARYVLRTSYQVPDDVINVALRKLRGQKVIYNPSLLGILPDDVGLI
jgi:hypothetical protein